MLKMEALNVVLRSFQTIDRWGNELAMVEIFLTKNCRGLQAVLAVRGLQAVPAVARLQAVAVVGGLQALLALPAT
jgi:hypothetical protein